MAGRSEMYRGGRSPERERGRAMYESERGFRHPSGEPERERRGFGERLKGRANEMVERRKDRVANRIDRVGQRLEHRGQTLEEQGGVKRMAGRVVQGSGERIERTAGYLRTHEVSTIKDDAKRQIREHPFLSVSAALGSGFFLGWFLHGGEEEEEHDKERGQKQSWLGKLGKTLMTGATGMATRSVQQRMGGGRRH